MELFIKYFEAVVFGYFAFSVFYVLIFALASFYNSRTKYTKSRTKFKFLIVIPSYKDDSVIFDSVQSALNIEYPSDKFEILVISDKMQDVTNDALMKLPLSLVKIECSDSSKANALKEAIIAKKESSFDLVLILDADNVVEKDVLEQINNVYYSGSRAIQLHRCAKELSSTTSILDAISEEINNAIYRKGHNTLGISSALIGSGMVFEYDWFCKNVFKLNSAGEDKELEILLFKDRIYVNYLDSVYVYDEKVKNERIYFNQRQRWLATQFGSLKKSLGELPYAVLSLNIDLIDKLVQWMLLPRVVMLGTIFIIAIFNSLFFPLLGLKWWILFLMLTFALIAVIPDYLITKSNIKALRKLPIIFILTIINFFRIKGANKKFIHTIKGR